MKVFESFFWRIVNNDTLTEIIDKVMYKSG